MSRARVRRVLVLPALWAPFHHGPAVAALAGYVRDTRPDGVVFLDAPEDGPADAWEAFTTVVASFRAASTAPIGVHGGGTAAVAALAGLNVTVLPTLAQIAPGWLAASVSPTEAERGVMACAEAANANIVTGGTGRLRLTGRAVPGDHGGIARAWLVFECGTLAADPAAGTLGFGVLEDDGATVTACPVRVGRDGSFTLHGAHYTGLVDRTVGPELPRANVQSQAVTVAHL
jgi:hypothetical protein